jgi:hypothetical protein
MSNAEVDFISSSEATSRLSQLLDTFLSIQQEYGWGGLLPTWRVVKNSRYRRTVDAYATGDNFNLSTKVFMALGAFSQSSELDRKAKLFFRQSARRL